VCVPLETPAGSRCASPTPTPTPTHTPLPDCLVLDDGGGTGLMPGYCGPSKEDCAQELCFEQPLEYKPNGMPTFNVVCTDGDPTCDFGPKGDRACLFRYAVCVDLYNIEKRFPCTHIGPATHTRMVFPSQTNPKTEVDRANRDAFEAAMLKAGAKLGTYKSKRSFVWDPPLVGPLCTDFIEFKLPVKQNARTLQLRPGKFRMVIRTGISSDPREDGDHTYWRCNPAL
jgi:hypothetical protein